jgi:hypothetical protein
MNMAKLLLDIPDEFMKNYKNDKFNDAINRVKYDIKDYRETIKGYGLSGNYEDEVLDMFIDAFEKSKLIDNEKELENEEIEEIENEKE